MAEVDRLTGEVAQIARHTLKQVQVVARDARRALACRPGDGRLGRLVGDLAETIAATERLLAQTDQRLAGNRELLVADLVFEEVRRDTPVTGLGQHRPRRPQNLDFGQT
jgi:hypothetical protein